MAAPLDNARAVLALLAGREDGGVGPIRRLAARFARASGACHAAEAQARFDPEGPEFKVYYDGGGTSARLPI